MKINIFWPNSSSGNLCITLYCWMLIWPATGATQQCVSVGRFGEERNPAASSLLILVYVLLLLPLENFRENPVSIHNNSLTGLPQTCSVGGREFSWGWALQRGGVLFEGSVSAASCSTKLLLSPEHFAGWEGTERCLSQLSGLQW